MLEPVCLYVGARVPVPVRVRVRVHTLQGWWLLGRWILSLLRLAKPIKIPRLHDVTLSMSYITHAMTIREMLKQSRVRPITHHGRWFEFGSELLLLFVSSFQTRGGRGSRGLHCPHPIPLQEDMSLVYIQPDVQQYYLLDYDKHEEIEQKGRAAAASRFKVRRDGVLQRCGPCEG